jgi:periplasmic divalent cation tolerance protein
MTEAAIVLVSCPAELAEKIAEKVVAERLAACVNILPSATSVYLWQGKLCRESESILLIKIQVSGYAELEKRIKELHTYDVPEIIMVSIAAGYFPYLNWIAESVGTKAESLERTEN